jgi:hypothetical protein
MAVTGSMTQMRQPAFGKTIRSTILSIHMAHQARSAIIRSFEQSTISNLEPTNGTTPFSGGTSSPQIARKINGCKYLRVAIYEPKAQSPQAVENCLPRESRFRPSISPVRNPS